MERYRLGDDDKIIMKTASGKAVRVIECILCASMSDNDNREQFIGVLLTSGKASLSWATTTVRFLLVFKEHFFYMKQK